MSPSCTRCVNEAPSRAAWRVSSCSTRNVPVSQFATANRCRLTPAAACTMPTPSKIADQVSSAPVLWPVMPWSMPRPTTNGTVAWPHIQMMPKIMPPVSVARWPFTTQIRKRKGERTSGTPGSVSGRTRTWTHVNCPRPSGHVCFGGLDLSGGEVGVAVDGVLDEQLAAVAAQEDFHAEGGGLDALYGFIAKQDGGRVVVAVRGEHVSILPDKTVQVHLVFAHDYVQQRLHDRSAPPAGAAGGRSAGNGHKRCEWPAPDAVRRIPADRRAVAGSRRPAAGEDRSRGPADRTGAGDLEPRHRGPGPVRARQSRPRRVR